MEPSANANGKLLSMLSDTYSRGSPALCGPTAQACFRPEFRKHLLLDSSLLPSKVSRFEAEASQNFWSWGIWIESASLAPISTQKFRHCTLNSGTHYSRHLPKCNSQGLVHIRFHSDVGPTCVWQYSMIFPLRHSPNYNHF